MYSKSDYINKILRFHIKCDTNMIHAHDNTRA